MVSSAPSRAGVEGWPGEWKKSPGLADFAGLLAWRQFRPRVSLLGWGPVPGLPAALPVYF